MHSERVTMDFSPEKKILTLHLINPLITTQEEGPISQSVTMDQRPLSINLEQNPLPAHQGQPLHQPGNPGSLGHARLSG